MKEIRSRRRCTIIGRLVYYILRVSDSLDIGVAALSVRWINYGGTVDGVQVFWHKGIHC